MDSPEPGPEINALTEKIIGCAYKVSNKMGCGFVEKVYENSLAHELRKNGLRAIQQQPIRVHYDGVVVGDFAADIVVEDQVILELKAVRALDSVHHAQCMNYLKATTFPICLLMNFGKPRLQIQRIAGKSCPPSALRSVLTAFLPFLGF